MSSPWNIVVLAAREGDLKPLRQELESADYPTQTTMVRNVAELARRLDEAPCDAVILTATVSHLNLAQSLADIRQRDATLPVILAVCGSDASTVVAALKGGVTSVVLTEALALLPVTLERDIRAARERRASRRPEQWATLAAALIENIPTALAVANSRGVLRWANPAYLALSGLSLDEVARGRVSLWGEGGPTPEIKEVLQGGTAWSTTVRASQADGGESLQEIRVSEIAVPNEEQPWLAVVREDLPKIKPETETGGSATQRAELFSAIAGGIALDLGNILAPIAMATSLLREHSLVREATELLDTIENSAERGAAVIKQVLTFARGSENCQMVLQPRLVVKEVARLATEVFPPSIGVRADVAAGLWPVVGDPAEIHQALVNILANARDAMPEGGEILVTARNARITTVPPSPFFEATPGDFVLVSVEDTGPGLPPNIAARMWEPFFTTKGTGHAAGLGLSRVAGVLRSHGGFAQVTSRSGRGTTVSLFFPRAAEEPAKAAAVSETVESETGKLLVVDDEQTILDLSRRILEKAGYEVLCAHDGREALALFARHRAEIRLVLTDLAMPGMNGFTLLWTLRRSKPDLRIMVATGQSSEATLRELEQMGVRHVLLKPFNARRLLNEVTQALVEPVACEPELFLPERAVNA